MVVSPPMFGYGSEGFDACVLMLFRMCFESTCSLAYVHLFTGAWHFVNDVCLLLHREGIFDISEERTEGGSLTLVRRELKVGPDLNTALMLKFLHTLLFRSLTPVT